MSYSSGFVFGDADNSTSACLKASFPVVYQVPTVTVTSGSGSTLSTLFSATTGSPMGYGGQIDNRGNCFGLLLTITYWGGSDCDNCTNTTLSSLTQTLYVKAGTVFNIPAGYWSVIEYQTTDSTATVANAVKDGEFSFYSSHTPNCPGCSPLVGDTIEPAARVSLPGKKEEGKK